MELISEKGKIVIRSLALKGSGNIDEIRRRENLEYPTVLRNIREFQKYGLVWLSDIQDRGPKSAQTYSLTPLGCLAASLYCIHDDELDLLIHHWRPYAPKIVEYWKNYDNSSFRGNFIKAIQQVFDTLYKEQTITEEREVPTYNWQVQKNMIDIEFFERLLKNVDGVDLNFIKKLLKNDGEYLETWTHWINLKMFIIESLRTLTNPN